MGFVTCGVATDTRSVVYLNGATLKVGRPRICAEELTPGKYLWFPGAWSMPTGEVLLTTLDQADAFVATGFGGASTPRSRLMRTIDGGLTYQQLYTVANMVEGLYPLGVAQGNNLYGASYQLKPNGAFPTASFLARRVLISDGGATWTQDDWVIPVTGFPRTASALGDVSWPSNIVKRSNGDLLSVFAIQYTGDTQVSAAMVKSTDNGVSWQYVSQVGGPADVRPSDEGPDEFALQELANSDLLCVARVVSNDQLMGFLSTDGGITWVKQGFYTNAQMRSVQPRTLLLDNGLLVLSTGRDGGQGGLYVGVATDGRGAGVSSWQTWNLYMWHNTIATVAYDEQMTTPGLLRKFVGKASNGLDTTGYTAPIKLSTPNTFRIYYDYTPQGHNAVSIWPGQIYSVDIEASAP